MTIEITEQTLRFCMWLNNKLKLHGSVLSNAIEYLDKKYRYDNIRLIETKEYKEFLIEPKRNAINDDFKV